MDLYMCNETETTPGVNFNPDTGMLIIEGKSIPNDAEKFFIPILEWLEEYVKVTKVKTTFILKPIRFLYMYFKYYLNIKLLLKIFQNPESQLSL